jgi:histidyl-tRNA synthetase
MQYQAPRGTKDILSSDIDVWVDIEDKARSLFRLYGYKEIRTPIFEQRDLFIRSLGETSDIVQKQLLNLSGDKKENLCLRPEATAPNVRLYIEHNVHKKEKFAKFCYLGPMFRGERPQKGRLRQFHHIGAEAIGATHPFLDVEVIGLAVNLLKQFGVRGHTLKINNLGCARDRKKLTDILTDMLRDKLDILCPNCRNRFERNILRIFDCKQKRCREIVTELELDTNHHCSDCKSYFADVLDGLHRLNIPYVLTPYLVRGLDYYRRTVFEITHDSLGSQDALGAGGRYDGLVRELGGPDIGAVGFALGVERVILVIPNDKTLSQNTIVAYLVTIGTSIQKKAIKLLDNLRQKGISCDMDYGNSSLKSQMRTADRLCAKCVILLGEEELDKGVATLKDLKSGMQTEVKQQDLAKTIKDRYKI